MRSIGDRVLERRKELGLSQTELGAAAGGLKYQAIQQIESGGGTKHILALAKALKVTPDWLEMEIGPKDLPDVGEPRSIPAGPGDFIPVLGLAQGGQDGWSLWNGQEMDRVPRPASLAGARGAYAVYVEGSSMEPRYFPGELLYIHPGKPAVPGSFVLVQLHPTSDGEPPRALLKRFTKRSGSKTILEQYNPPKIFEIKTAEIQSIHKVVGAGEA